MNVENEKTFRLIPCKCCSKRN